MSQKISKEDQDRIESCEHYVKTKQVMKNLIRDKEMSVGEVYFIKYKSYDGKWHYETSGYGDETPSKYMVFHVDDDGFVFVKRIIASGNLGKEVLCLTTQYDATSYKVEPDPDFVNSILLENEDGYDPLAASKELSSKKNKARRKNKKLEISYDTPLEAYTYVSNMKVGDTIYDADTAYGGKIVKWNVTSIEKRPTDQSEPDRWSRHRFNNGSAPRGNSYEDQSHNAEGFKELISVTIEPDLSTSKRRYVASNRKLTFKDFQNERYSKYYKSKPFTVEDV